MLDIFSTREIAIGIWILLLVVFVFISKKTREAALNVIKAVCNRHIIVLFLVVICYAAGITLLFSFTGIWQCIYLKDIIIWTLFVGLSICFGAVSVDTEEHYFKKIVINNLKFTIIVEFFISSFTFNIIVELIMLPLLTFIVLTEAVAAKDEKYKPAKKVLSVLIAIIGFTILGFTLKHAINEYSSLSIIDSLVSFSIPIILSILYLPVSYGFAVFAKYQMIFIRMGFYKWSDKLNRQRKWKVIKVCCISYRKLVYFEKKYIAKMYKTISEEDFDRVIDEFKSAYMCHE